MRPFHLGVLVALLAALLSPAAAAAGVPACPKVSAPSTIVVEASRGQIACATRPNDRRAIASATKLMTALLVLERAKLSDVMPAARYRALPIESKLNLVGGERLTVADLLRGLLLESANDAAVTLAEGLSGSRAAFVRDMNTRARELGLERTRFANPIGLDAPGNRSSAHDLAMLTLELRKFAFFRKTVNRASVTLESGSRPRTVANRNTLVRSPQFPWITGVKTGHTRGAGWVLVGSGVRNNIELVSVVLGASSERRRSEDTLSVLRDGFRRFSEKRPVRRGQRFALVPIKYGRGAELPLVSPRTVRYVKMDGDRRRFTKRARGVPTEIEGPVRRGERLATLEVFLGRELVATVPLVAAAAVPEAGVAQRTKDYFTRPSTMLLILAVLGSTLLLARLRTRTRTPRSRAAAGGAAREPEAA